MLSAIALTGCESGRATRAAVGDFYRSDFASAREGFRASAERRPFHEDSLLDNARFGMSNLASGDVNEASRALGTAYKLLESGGVNDEARIFAATVLHEGVKVYKGEPFEQAMVYSALAFTNALRGDWENVRVCARATVRRLADFQNADPTASDRFRREGVALVETDFALGYLLEGIADRVLGEDDSALDRAVSLNSSLREVVERVRSGRFNTIAFIEFGRGPSKEQYGDDGAMTRWVRNQRSAGELAVFVTGTAVAGPAKAAADVNRMAEDHRWNNLENARKFKSGLGTVMILGGATTALASEDKGAQIAGVAVAATGLLMKLLSSADTRHNELLPSEVFVAAFELPPEGANVEIVLSGAPAERVTLNGARPGTPTAPTVMYARVTPYRGGGSAPGVASWRLQDAARLESAERAADDAWNAETRILQERNPSNRP